MALSFLISGVQKLRFCHYECTVVRDGISLPNTKIC